MRKKKKVSTSRDGNHWLVTGQDINRRMGGQGCWDKTIQSKIQDECEAKYGVSIHLIRKIFDATVWIENCYPDVLKDPPERFALTQALLLRSIHRLDPSCANRISPKVFEGTVTGKDLKKIRERLWLKRHEGAGPVISPKMPKAIRTAAFRSESIALEHVSEDAGVRVRGDRVAIRALPGRRLRLDGQNVLLPAGSCLDLDIDVVATLAPTALLVVDKWDVFTTLDQLNIDISLLSTSNILMLYRGDRISYSTAAAQQLIEAVGCPVYDY